MKSQNVIYELNEFVTTNIWGKDATMQLQLLLFAKLWANNNHESEANNNKNTKHHCIRSHRFAGNIFNHT